MSVLIEDKTMRVREVSHHQILHFNILLVERFFLFSFYKFYYHTLREYHVPGDCYFFFFMCTFVTVKKTEKN